MVRAWWRKALGAASVLLVASCSGGGCSSGCQSCGVTPLPGGFPKDKTIENAGSVRMTRPALDFLATNAPDLATQLLKAPNGQMSFGIPQSVIGPNSLALGYDLGATICVGGPDETTGRCTATVDIKQSTFKLDAVKANALRVRGVLPLVLKNTPVNARLTHSILPDLSITLYIGYGDGGCSGGRPAVGPHALPIDITLPIVAENVSPRDGYAKIDAANAVVDLNAINADQVQICSDCGFASALCSAITNSSLIKNQIVGQLKSGLDSQVKSLLNDQLCTAPTPGANPPCPTGSKPNAGNTKCVYNSDANKCVPTLLGMDGHMDLSSALKSISPGASGGIDIGLAAGGDMKPLPSLDPDNVPYVGHTKNGATLGMLGGAIPQPQSNCVPKADIQIPTGIPIPDELTKDDIGGFPQGTPPHHLGIALAGRFLNYALGSVYNSGLLCLGVSTEQLEQLNSGLVSLLIPSIKKLSFEQKAASLAIGTRPQTAPELKLGSGADVKTDPLLAITMKKFAIDFYVWSYDRYVRAFTFEGDIKIPVNLQTGKSPKNPNGGLLPSIGDLTIANAKVTNSDLLTEDPAAIAAGLQSILSGLVGQAIGGGISPVDVSGALSSLGLGLTIPEGGIRKLTKGSDDFIGLFATLSKAAPTATLESDTHAKLVSKEVHADAMSFAGYDRERLPVLTLALGSSLDDGKNAVEYSYTIDKGLPSPWTRAKELKVKEDYLFYQGNHTLHVTSRLVGQPETEDSSPADVPFRIDVLPPELKLEETDKGFTLSAYDFVSPSDKLEFRTKVGDGAVSAWAPLAKDQVLPATAPGVDVEVEVRDEEGNIGRSSSALIRGKSDATLGTATGGCGGCATSGDDHAKDATSGLLATALVALSLLAIRKRREQQADPAPLAGRAGTRASSSRFHAALGLGSLLAVTATSQGCSCGGEDPPPTGENSVLCGADCKQQCEAALKPGIVGAYTSAAKAPDGTLFVAGYNDAVLSNDGDTLYGDLVVGRYDTGKQAVQWETVDGVPAREAGTCPDHDRTGWRKGETESGDDVGLWTSIQVGSDGAPRVVYYDATHKSLKYATKRGDAWTSYVLKAPPTPAGDYGRYAKMILVDDKPVVAFLAMEPGTAGKALSHVVVARASSPSPADGGAWAFEDAAADKAAPCRVGMCTGKQTCVKDTGTCTDTATGCSPADCGAGKACVAVSGKATCVSIINANSVEAYPNAFGAYVSLAKTKDGLGVVFYDRVHGNLVGAQQAGGKWTTFLLDGETGSRDQKTAKDTGDVGIGAHLSVADDGTWHVSYVSGLDETLRYLSVSGGKASAPEIVDNGSSVDGKPFPDGKHVVGDDSFVVTQGSGIAIYYQDATVGTLRVATSAQAAGGRTWNLKTLVQPNKFAGFFPSVVAGETKVLNFWRQTDKATKDIVGDVTLVQP